MVTWIEKFDFSADAYFWGIGWGLGSGENVDRMGHIAPADVITY